MFLHRLISVAILAPVLQFGHSVSATAVSADSVPEAAYSAEGYDYGYGYGNGGGYSGGGYNGGGYSGGGYSGGGYSGGGGGSYQGSNCVMYEVRPGDYCYKIAANNGIPYQQFLAQNPGIDCTRLYVGQSVCLLPLTLPGWWYPPRKTLESPSPSSCKSYTVRDGDLCAMIASQNSISVDRLLEINANSPSWSGCERLLVGQVICI